MRHVTVVDADCDNQFNSSFINGLSQYQTHKLPNEFIKNPHYQMTEFWANVFMIFNFSFILKPFFQQNFTTTVNADGRLVFISLEMHWIELFKGIIIYEIALCFNRHFISNSLCMNNNLFVLYFLLRKLRHANCYRQKKE